MTRDSKAPFTMLIGGMEIPLTDFSMMGMNHTATNNIPDTVHKCQDVYTLEGAITEFFMSGEIVTGIVMHEDDFRAMERALLKHTTTYPNPAGRTMPPTISGIPITVVKLPLMKGHVVKLMNGQSFADWFKQNYSKDTE